MKDASICGCQDTRQISVPGAAKDHSSTVQDKGRRKQILDELTKMMDELEVS